MNKIFTILVMSLMLSSFVSAYDFNYERPNLDVFTNQIFQMSKIIPSISQSFYQLLGIARFYEDKSARCEVALIKCEARSCGGGNSVTYVQQENEQETEIEYLICDINKDKNVDLQDFGIWKDCLNEFGTNVSTECDSNGDGLMDLQDFGIWKDCINNHFGE